MNWHTPRARQLGSTTALLVTALIWGMCFVAQRSGMEHLGPFLFNGLRYVLGAATLALVLLGMILVERRRFARLRGTSGARVGAQGTTVGLGVTESLGSADAHNATVGLGSAGAQGVTESLSGAAELNGSGVQGATAGNNSAAELNGFGVQGATAGNNSAAELNGAGAHKKGRPAAGGVRSLLIAGGVCGMALYVASNLQQWGMVEVTASKAAFITTLYIVLVPILGLALRQKTHWNTWVSVGIAVVGLYLLCISESFTLEPGDTIVLVSALFWAIHILAVGHFAPRLGLTQLLGMCVVQFCVAGALSLATAPLIDHSLVAVPPSLEAVQLVAPELLYAGILSTAVAFTLAAIGQKYAKPAPAAVIMSLESVFGLLGGMVVLHEALSGREAIGCVLMFVAVILTQLEFKRPGQTRPPGQPRAQPPSYQPQPPT